MEQVKIAIIGGGASGLYLANALAHHSGVLLVEGEERLGRKLSATGNGQGNVTHVNAEQAEYFSLSGGEERAKEILQRFNALAVREFYRSLGVSTVADERGRVYPSGRQASALTDALRFSLQTKKVPVRLSTRLVDLEKAANGFRLTLEKEGKKELLFAEQVVLCTGGKAAKNFGTDGSVYSLVERLGHTVTPTYPSLVQLKTDVAYTKTLKGIRVTDGTLRAQTPTREESASGDIIFTDYGVSGDTVFRLSAFIAAEVFTGNCCLHIDFLPAYGEEEIYRLLLAKRDAFPDLPSGELLFGVVNNQIGRAVLRRAKEDLRTAARLVKDFSLPVTGSLGFDYAQVTKGGVPLSELTEGLESKKAKGLYFAGELLDVDGQCGGYNLQWAFSSAFTVAQTLAKGRG